MLLFIRYYHLTDGAGFHAYQRCHDSLPPMKSSALPPPINSLSGLTWGISPDGMNCLTDVSSTDNSHFHNAFLFYRDALMAKFLHCLQQVLDAFEAKHTSTPSLRSWSNTMLGTASMNAMMGPRSCVRTRTCPHPSGSSKQVCSCSSTRSCSCVQAEALLRTASHAGGVHRIILGQEE